VNGPSLRPVTAARVVIILLVCSLFLSYARADDESFVRKLYDDLTAAGFDVWFDRVSMPSRGLTFTKEIEDAIAYCERFLPVVGPAALASEYVTRELGFAVRTGKAVTPIIRIGRPRDLSGDLRLLDVRDFTEDSRYAVEFKRLLQQVREQPARMGKLIAVPSLPQHFLFREERLRKLKETLRADTLRGPRDILHRPIGVTSQARSAGLHGMGGIGKSVLAATLCHEIEVRRNFPDGIAWVTLGQKPNIVALQRDLVAALGGNTTFDSISLGRSRLSDALRDKAVLLVIDDVWERHHSEAFDALASRCRMLITTRDASIITALGGTHHPIGVLTDGEARALLAEWAATTIAELPSEADTVIRECGYLPLALAICGAMIRDKAARWHDLVEAFADADLKFLDHAQGIKGYEHPNLFKAIRISVDALDEPERRCFAELVVFPPDRETPAAAAYVVWGQIASLRERHGRALLAKLVSRSLVQAGDSADAPFVLHDVIYDYAAAVAGDRTILHQALVEAYAKRCKNGWPSGPDDGYFFQNLTRHLGESGRHDELLALLLDLDWLETKTSKGLALDLPTEFNEAHRAIWPDQARSHLLPLIEDALRRDINFIAQHASDYPQGLFQCLWNSCWWYDCSESDQLYRRPDTRPSRCHATGSTSPAKSRLALWFGTCNLVNACENSRTPARGSRSFFLRTAQP